MILKITKAGEVVVKLLHLHGILMESSVLSCEIFTSRLKSSGTGMLGKFSEKVKM